VEGSIYVIFIKATEVIITGIDIFDNKDSITLIYLIEAFLPQNSNKIPLNQEFVLYKAFLRDS
jgi:hypothetical protein